PPLLQSNGTRTCIGGTSALTLDLEASGPDDSSSGPELFNLRNFPHRAILLRPIRCLILGASSCGRYRWCKNATQLVRHVGRIVYYDDMATLHFTDTKSNYTYHKTFANFEDADERY